MKAFFKNEVGEIFVRLAKSGGFGTRSRTRSVLVTRVRNDQGRLVTRVGDEDSEADVRTRYPGAIGELKLQIGGMNLTPDAVESLLNVLCQDLLPGGRLTKVKRI
jgi:hypothetical protein